MFRFSTIILAINYLANLKNLFEFCLNFGIFLNSLSELLSNVKGIANFILAINYCSFANLKNLLFKLRNIFKFFIRTFAKC